MSNQKKNNLQSLSNKKGDKGRTVEETCGWTYRLKRSFSVMPSRLVPMDMISRPSPQNTWMGRYEARNHDDAKGNRKNIKPITHWEKKEAKGMLLFQSPHLCVRMCVCVCTCRKNMTSVAIPTQLCREYISGIAATLWKLNTATKPRHTHTQGMQ